MTLPGAGDVMSWSGETNDLRIRPSPSFAGGPTYRGSRYTWSGKERDHAVGQWRASHIRGDPGELGGETESVTSPRRTVGTDSEFARTSTEPCLI